MQLQQLRYVVEVHHAGSISKAAENLFLTQPYLSSSISELEKELGIQLFYRNNRGVTITDEGRVFLSYARGIVDQFTSLEQLYSQTRKDTATLRFAWSVDTAYVPCRFLRELPPNAPLNIHLMEGTHLDVLGRLMRKEADLGAVFIPEAHLREYERYGRKQGLVLKKLWKVPLSIVVSAQSRLAEEKMIRREMLTGEYIQMIYRPAGIYDLPNSTAPKAREVKAVDRSVYFNDRGTLLEILASNPVAYVQSLSTDPEVLSRGGLVARPQTLSEHRFIKLLLYNKQTLSKEMKWVMRQFEEMKTLSHPCWAGLEREYLEGNVEFYPA